MNELQRLTLYNAYDNHNFNMRRTGGGMEIPISTTTTTIHQQHQHLNTDEDEEDVTSCCANFCFNMWPRNNIITKQTTEDVENSLKISDKKLYIHAQRKRDMKDRFSMFILLVLYTLQGIPMGLSGSIPLLLKERNVSFEGLALFSLVSIPFSLKLLWAPLVDSVYIRALGMSLYLSSSSSSSLSLYLYISFPRPKRRQKKDMVNTRANSLWLNHDSWRI